MNPAHSYLSSVGPAIARYLALKRALGRLFRVEGGILAALDRFLAKQRPAASAVTPETFAAWTLTFARLSPTVRRNWMRVVRNLCLYIRRDDAGYFVPDSDTFPAPHPRHLPHIFTEQQILQALRAAADLQTRPNSPLCAAVFRLAIVLLYTAGLRRGEVVRLAISDYDPAQRTLHIRESKFHKSRIVALSDDASREMETYLIARRRLPDRADAPLLTSRFNGRRGYSGPSLGHSLHRLLRRAGVRTSRGLVPRVHDFRHTYAVHTLSHWYRTGVDVQAKLPALAAAMGHVSIVSTAYYLPFLEPVAEAASERFARRCQQLLADLDLGGTR